MSSPASSGSSAVLIESSALQVHIRPDVGGKIAQIVDLRSGKEILVPPQKPYATIPPGASPGASWMNGDRSGMDDCFPNIASGPYPSEPWKGTPLPDHGEWVYGAWQIESVSAQSVRLRRAGSVLPYSARKTIRLEAEDTIRIDYEVENHSDFPLAYLWAAHPMILAGEAAYSLTLPKGTRRIRTFPEGLDFEWPLFNGIDLSRNWIPAGRTLKCFALDLTEGWCELRLGRSLLRFEFDLAETPKLGLWFNNLGFPPSAQNRFRCIAIEPCTSASDRLDDLAQEDCATIAAKDTKRWSMTLKVQSQNENH